MCPNILYFIDVDIVTDSSTEQYTDTTGINLGQFIVDTLNKNAKDRHLLLKIEHELVNLAKDKRLVCYNHTLVLRVSGGSFLNS